MFCFFKKEQTRKVLTQKVGAEEGADLAQAPVVGVFLGGQLTQMDRAQPLHPSARRINHILCLQWRECVLRHSEDVVGAESLWMGVEGLPRAGAMEASGGAFQSGLARLGHGAQRRGCRADARAPCPDGDSRCLFQPPWARSGSR